MSNLELKVPPVIGLVLFAFFMWVTGRTFSMTSINFPYALMFAIVAFLIGTGIAIAGVLSFHNAKTTVNPIKPQASTSIVTSGIYRLSRNPMYLGFLVILVGWSVFLSNSFTFLFLALYVIYMNHFQIIPEERILTDKFGDTYIRYKQSVRRWL